MATDDRPSAKQIRAWQDEIRILTGDIDHILQWEREGRCSAMYMLHFGGRRIARVIQLADKLERAGAPLWADP